VPSTQSTKDVETSDDDQPIAPRTAAEQIEQDFGTF
jgi:hypothetical protein